MAAKNKTVPFGLAIEDYLAAISDEARRADCTRLHAMMSEISGFPAKMWGAKLSSAIAGYGEYHYKYDSGREGDAPRLGFSSRAQNISIYIMPGYDELGDELSRLGKHKVGKSCLYIKRLSDVDEAALRDIMTKSFAIMAERYPL